MAKAIINRFDGGIAEDVRTTSTNQCASSVNFDTQTNPHKLIPYSDPVAETHAGGTTTDYNITDVAVVNVSSVPTIYSLGRYASGNADSTIFKKNSTSDITASWATYVATNSNDQTPGTLVEYKDKLYFVGGGATLHSFTAPSTITAITTSSGPYTTNFAPKPFVHPIDYTLYWAVANKLYKYDGVTYTTVGNGITHTFEDNFEISSLTSWGSYLAIGGRYVSRTRRSLVYLSNRIIPNDGVQQVIDWGEGSLVAIENIDGYLVGVSYTEDVGSYSSTTSYKLYIKVYAGGEVQTVKEIQTNRSDEIKIWKAKNGKKLYFGYDTDRSLYCVGRNRAGEWFVVGDRYYTPTGSYITGTFNGVSFIGDIAFISYQDGGTTGYLVRQGTSSTYSLTSYYETTVNPNMDVSHRTLRKKLKNIRVSYTVNSANGTIGIGLRQDSQTASYTSVISETKSSTGEYVTHADMNTDGTGFDEGYELQFQLSSTGNVSIKQFEYEYELIND